MCKSINKICIFGTIPCKEIEIISASCDNMALADSRTYLQESQSGTLYGVHRERVAVQGSNGEWVAGIRQTEIAAVPHPDGAVRLVTRTWEAIGIVSSPASCVMPP